MSNSFGKTVVAHWSMTIYPDAITNVFVTGKLRALYHGDHNYYQCQVSKMIKDKNIIPNPLDIHT